MNRLGKLSSFAAVAGLTAMLTVPVAPAQAQISPEGSNALLGAGIGGVSALKITGTTGTAISGFKK